MTFVMTAILVACSVDDVSEQMNDPTYQNTIVEINGYRIRWIADKKTVGHTSDYSLVFDISYQNMVKQCKLYIDPIDSALSMDEKQNNLLGILKVDSMEISGGGTSLMDKNGFSLTFSGERY